MQPANTDSRLPWSFLYPHLQCHAFSVIHCGVGAWHVKTCVRTSSRKWKHGISLSGMPSFFVLNSVTVSPQHVENFSRPLEMMHKMLSEGRTIVEDEQRSGQPSTTRTSDNTTRVWELVRSDRRLTVKMIADEVNVNREAVRRILTEELGMGKICAKMVPRNLTERSL